MAEDKEKTNDAAWGYLALGVLAIAVAVFMAIPAILAFILFLLTRPHLTRRNYAVIAAFGLGSCVITVPAYWAAYGQWVVAALQKDFNISGFPTLLTLSATTLLLGVFGMVSSTRIADRFPWAGAKAPLPTERDTILPSEQQRERVSSIVAAPGSMAVSKGVNSVTSTGPQSARAFPIGMDFTGKRIMLSEDQIKTHAMVLGATGSGKTETIKVLAGGLLDLGWSGMVLDLKEDVAPGGLRDWCSLYAQHHGLPYQELRLSNPDSETWFNPLAGMGPDEIRDTILSLQSFDDAYWQALNKKLLGQLVNLLVWAHAAAPDRFPAPSMYDLGQILGSGNLKQATKHQRAAVLAAIPGVGEGDFSTLENPDAATSQSAAGFGAKLSQFYDTQAGRTVLRPGERNERRLIDVTQTGLTYVGLDSQGKADLTSVISSAMLQRMSVYAAQRVTGHATEGAVRPRFLIVDEANWVNRTIVQSLLSRARSAGIAMILCTQGPKDWIDEQGDDWGKLTQNVNVAVIMAQGEAESARICADYIGQIYKKQSSEQLRTTRGLFGQRKAVTTADGKALETVSVREELTHVVDPDDLRRMRVGEAILRVRFPQELVTWMRMPRRDPAQPAGD